MQVGDTVFLAYASVYMNEPKAIVVEAAIVANIDGELVFRPSGGTARTAYYSETLHATEADAWAACAIELSRVADAVRAAADAAAVKAAKGAVTVTA